jgi:putative Holliday junction resolvase
MPVCNPIDLHANVAKTARLMAFDVGTKTIGLALSDPAKSLATPLETVWRTKFAADARAILVLVERWQIGGLVVGLPLNMDGSAGPRAQASRAFARNLLERLDLPLVLWDERLSTMAVERAMIEADVSRAKRAERIDSAAAAFILQGVLDYLRLNKQR